MIELTQEQMDEIERQYEEAKNLYRAARYEEAVAIYSALTDSGYLPAWCDLGLCSLEGKLAESDYAKAAEQFKYAADAGYYYGHICLGACYELGVGVTRDKKQAKAHLEAAVAAFGKDAKAIYKGQLKIIKARVASQKSIDRLQKFKDYIEK